MGLITAAGEGISYSYITTAAPTETVSYYDKDEDELGALVFISVVIGE